MTDDRIDLSFRRYGLKIKGVPDSFFLLAITQDDRFRLLRTRSLDGSPIAKRQEKFLSHCKGSRHSQQREEFHLRTNKHQLISPLIMHHIKPLATRLRLCDEADEPPI